VQARHCGNGKTVSAQQLIHFRPFAFGPFLTAATERKRAEQLGLVKDATPDTFDAQLEDSALPCRRVVRILLLNVFLRRDIDGNR